MNDMASTEGFEPPTPGLGSLCAILLRYVDLMCYYSILRACVKRQWYTLLCAILETNTTALDHQMLSAAIGSVNVAVHVDSPCLLIVIRFTMRSCKNIRVVPRCLGCHVAG